MYIYICMHVYIYMYMYVCIYIYVMSAQTLIHHVPRCPSGSLRRPLPGSGGWGVQGRGAEPASEFSGDTTLPPPLRGRGPLGGLRPLRQRLQRNRVWWVTSFFFISLNLLGCLVGFICLFLLCWHLKTKMCSCGGFQFWGNVHGKRSHGLVVEHESRPRQPQRPQVKTAGLELGK